MALSIRLSRGGSKKRPYYRIVVADARSPRDGRFIEKLGTYNPLLAKDDENRVRLVEDRVNYWLGVGAQPTDRVARMLDKAGIKERAATTNPNKGEPGKKAKERAEEKADKAREAEEAAAAAAAAPAPEPEPVVEEVAAEAPAEETAAEAPAEEAPAAEAPAEAPAEEANEATPNSDAGDTPSETAGESAQDNAEG